MRGLEVLVGVASVSPLVAEVGEDHEDLVGLLAAELDVLVLASSRPSSAAAAALTAVAGVLAVPTFTTVLAPRFSTLPLPFSSSVRASSRSARRFSSSGFGSSSARRLGPACRHCAAAVVLHMWGLALAVTAGMPRVVPSPAATTRLNSPADFFRTVPPSTAIVSREGAAREEHGQSRAQRCGWHLTERVHVGRRAGATRARPGCATAVAVARQSNTAVCRDHKASKPGSRGHVCATAHSRKTVRVTPGVSRSDVSTVVLDPRRAWCGCPSASSWSWPAAPPITGPSTVVPS